MVNIDVSYVLTVYNKEKYLPAVIAALLSQEGSLQREYIFVDDVSTDRSVAVIKALTDGVPHVQVLQNTKNMGPSISLNRGCKIAKGEYLHLIDADDILPKNASNVLIRVMEKYQADLLYGNFKKTGKSAEELVGVSMIEDFNVKVSREPLAAVLGNRCVRMALVVKNALYQKARGCDERIFIQDESLPLRLAYDAKCFVKVDVPVILVPDGAAAMSNNKNQQHYDRFMAYYYAFHEFVHLTRQCRVQLYKRAVSTVWKSKRSIAAWHEKIKFFVIYSLVDLMVLKPDGEYLEQLKQYINGLENVRKLG